MHMIRVSRNSVCLIKDFVLRLIRKYQYQGAVIFQDADKFSERIGRVYKVFNQMTGIHIIIGIIRNRYLIMNHIAGNINRISTGFCIRLFKINSITVLFHNLITTKTNITTFSLAISQYPASYFSRF